MADKEQVYGVSYVTAFARVLRDVRGGHVRGKHRTRCQFGADLAD
ncbi:MULTISPECIES: hypothetical protein [unclassified Pseudomonas]|nr:MULTISPECIES: hypothetical protein [unclassified Pseudomonas]